MCACVTRVLQCVFDVKNVKIWLIELIFFVSLSVLPEIRRIEKCVPITCNYCLSIASMTLGCVGNIKIFYACKVRVNHPDMPNILEIKKSQVCSNINILEYH